MICPIFHEDASLVVGLFLLWNVQQNHSILKLYTEKWAKALGALDCTLVCILLCFSHLRLHRVMLRFASLSYAYVRCRTTFWFDRALMMMIYALSSYSLPPLSASLSPSFPFISSPVTYSFLPHDVLPSPWRPSFFLSFLFLSLWPFSSLSSAPSFPRLLPSFSFLLLPSLPSLLPALPSFLPSFHLPFFDRAVSLFL